MDLVAEMDLDTYVPTEKTATKEMAEIMEAGWAGSYYSVWTVMYMDVDVAMHDVMAMNLSMEPSLRKGLMMEIMDTEMAVDMEDVLNIVNSGLAWSTKIF